LIRCTPSFHTNSVDNETFAFFAEESSRTDFLSAKSRCSDFGSLAQPRSAQEQVFIHSISQGRNVWIGSRVPEDYEGYMPRNIVILDQEAANSSYRNWKEGEPTCYTYCCGIKMVEGGYWGSFFCGQRAHVLCRIKKEYVDDILNENHAETSTTTMASTNILTTTSTPTTSSTATTTSALMIEIENKVKRLEREVDVLQTELLSMRTFVRDFQETTVKEMKEYVNTSLTTMSVDFKSAINSLYNLIENRTQTVE